MIELLCNSYTILAQSLCNNYYMYLFIPVTRPPSLVSLSPYGPISVRIYILKIHGSALTTNQLIIRLISIINNIMNNLINNIINNIIDNIIDNIMIGNIVIYIIFMGGLPPSNPPGVWTPKVRT
jgi:hypothetical protein